MPVRIRKRRIAEGIYLLSFKTQYELTSTFLRVQEHYESPKFSGRVFTLEEYMDWYAAGHNNKFSYYEDWSGYNVPSCAFQPFYAGDFDPLSEKEKRLLGLFKGLRGRFYVIGIFDADQGKSLTHELAHALFFIDDAYNKAVKAAMRGYDTSALARDLASEGYARHVIEDEKQAYIIAPAGKLGAVSNRLKPLRHTLRTLFREHGRKLKLSGVK